LPHLNWFRGPTFEHRTPCLAQGRAMNLVPIGDAPSWGEFPGLTCHEGENPFFCQPLAYILIITSQGNTPKDTKDCSERVCQLCEPTLSRSLQAVTASVCSKWTFHSPWIVWLFQTFSDSCYWRVACRLSLLALLVLLLQTPQSHFLTFQFRFQLCGLGRASRGLTKRAAWTKFMSHIYGHMYTCHIQNGFKCEIIYVNARCVVLISSDLSHAM